MEKRFVPIFMVFFSLLYLSSAYFPSSLADTLISAVSGALIVLLFWQMRGWILWMYLALVLAGTALLAASGASAEAYAQALRFHAGIATLFVVIPLLALPIQQGKFERAMKEVLTAYGKNATAYSLLTMLMNFVIAIFVNMGAYILVHSLTGRSGGRWRIVQGKSLLRGFVCSILVSPYFVAMGMITLYFHVSWIEVTSVTCWIVLVMFLLHYVEMRWKFGKMEEPVEERAPARDGVETVSRGAKIKLFQLGVSMLVFTAVLLLIESNTAYPMVTLVCTASLFAPIIGFMLLKQTGALIPALKEQYLYGKLPMIGKEVALMLCAGFFSDAFRESGLTDRMLAWLPDGGGPSGWLVLAAMTAVLYLFSVVGFHPIIVVTVILSVFSRADLGFPAGVVPAIILSVWALSLGLSPFSGSGLLLAGLMKTSSFTISVVWNWKYTLLATLLMFAVAYILY